MDAYLLDRQLLHHERKTKENHVRIFGKNESSEERTAGFMLINLLYELFFQKKALSVLSCL